MDKAEYRKRRAQGLRGQGEVATFTVKYTVPEEVVQGEPNTRKLKRVISFFRTRRGK